MWRVINPQAVFPGTGRYWENRYASGGNSGAGSYNRLAAYKAEMINAFLSRHGIRTAIEFGCGDGNQLALMHYESYLGFDVSPRAVEICRAKFAQDESKTFKTIDEYAEETAELTLSLDVIYHLIEDSVFDAYMRRLFGASEKFVVIYSSNDESLNQRYGGYHVRHRQFTDWIDRNAHGWRLVESVPNRYPYLEFDPDNTSLADFFFYRKTA
jgi:SAM-dependent methyltransferase